MRANVGRIAIALAVVTAPWPAHASVTYLTCEFYNGQFRVRHDFSLNEQTGKADFSREGWTSTANLLASFTADRVEIVNGNFTYSINRRTLAYKFTSDDQFGFKSYTGQCRIDPARGQRF
jgi:hypothetical protein